MGPGRCEAPTGDSEQCSTDGTVWVGILVSGRYAMAEASVFGEYGCGDFYEVISIVGIV